MLREKRVLVYGSDLFLLQAHYQKIDCADLYIKTLADYTQIWLEYSIFSAVVESSVETRYHLCKKYSSETSKLPPGVFLQHVKRACCPLMVWVTSNLSGTRSRRRSGRRRGVWWRRWERREGEKDEEEIWFYCSKSFYAKSIIHRWLYSITLKDHLYRVSSF